MYIQMPCVVWYCVFADSLISIFTAHKMPLHEDSDSVVSGRGDDVVDEEVDDEVDVEIDNEADDEADGKVDEQQSPEC